MIFRDGETWKANGSNGVELSVETITIFLPVVVETAGVPRQLTGQTLARVWSGFDWLS